MQIEQSGRNDSEPHLMSTENATTHEPSRYLNDEGCQHPRRPNSRNGEGDPMGGVSEGGMTGKGSEVSQEASNDIWLQVQPQTPSSSVANPRKAGEVAGGVGSAHSSDDTRKKTTRKERADRRETASQMEAQTKAGNEQHLS
jgi:hypothetical protein